MKNPNGRLSSPFNDEYRKPVSWKPVFVFGLHRKHKIFKKWITTLWTWKALVWVTQQHDSFLYTGWHKKTVITKNRITSKILFRLTQNFSYIRSSLCSRHLQSFKSVLQKLFVSLALKKCAPDELPGSAGTLGSCGQRSRWPSHIPPLGSLLLLMWLLLSGQG